MQMLGSKQGFTLIELSLSIAFISILSITVALIINDAISTYRRGLTLNQINTTGMDLVDDIRTVVQNSPYKAAVSRCTMYDDPTQRGNCEEDGAQKFIVLKQLAKVDVDKDNKLDKDVPVFGAFCTGAYSYIWNSGYFYAEDVDIQDGFKKPASLKYKDNSGAEVTKDDFRLIKIQDRERAVCISKVKEKSPSSLTYPSPSSSFTIESSEFNIVNDYDEVLKEPEILLANDTTNTLALYDLIVAKPAANNINSMFYSISFILGTVQGGINVMSSGNFCTTPSGFDSNFDYCAINKFNFAAQANGG